MSTKSRIEAVAKAIHLEIFPNKPWENPLNEEFRQGSKMIATKALKALALHEEKLAKQAERRRRNANR